MLFIKLIIKNKNMERTREEAFIKINDVNEIEISEYISTIENFEEMIREASLISGLGEVKIKMRPIKQGSVDIRMVVDFFDFMGQSGFSGGANVLTYITVAIGIVKFCKGVINKFKKEDKSIVYESPSGETKEVSPEIHRIIQSPVFRSAVIDASKALFEKSNNVNSYEFGSQEISEKISKSDKEFLKNYKESPLDEEFEESKSTMHGLYVKPIRGSYSGENTRYTFSANQQKFYPTIIKDEDFRLLLKNGEKKLFSEDLLKVDLTTTQRFSRVTRRTIMSYSIDRVHEYIPYRRQDQLKMID
nr:MAG TPA: hypothetical protein [Caudoviricetes sp.]